MQVFLIAWCCWKKTCLTIKLLFISLCLQHFNPRKESIKSSTINIKLNFYLILRKLLKMLIDQYYSFVSG